MTLAELAMDTPEADAMARNILTTLYELAAAAQGARLASIEITRKNTKQNAPTVADCESALPGTEIADSAPVKVIGSMDSIAQNGRNCNA